MSKSTYKISVIYTIAKIHQYSGIKIRGEKELYPNFSFAAPVRKSHKNVNFELGVLSGFFSPPELFLFSFQKFN